MQMAAGRISCIANLRNFLPDGNFLPLFHADFTAMGVKRAGIILV
jgi:hypothetical protein